MAKGKKVETIIEDRFTKQQIVNSKNLKIMSIYLMLY